MEISVHVSESIKTKHFTIYHAVQPLELWRNSPQGRSLALQISVRKHIEITNVLIHYEKLEHTSNYDHVK